MPVLDGTDLGVRRPRASARGPPPWLSLARRAVRAGDAGPADLQRCSTTRCASRYPTRSRPGLAVVTDGEIARQRFLWNVVERLSGLKAVAPLRRVGAVADDAAPTFLTTERVGAPDGLGLVAEHAFVRTLTSRPLKVCCPGPLTLALPITAADGYRDGGDLAD